MKMARNLIIFGVVAVAVAVLVFVVVPMTKPKPEPTATPAPTVNVAELQLTNQSADNVAEVTLEQGSSVFTLAKPGGKYVVKGREELVLDQDTAKTVFTNVAAVTATAVISANPTDYEQFGLKNPQAKATAKFSDGKTVVFLLGNKLTSGVGYYLMKDGDPKVYSASPGVGNAYLSSVNSLLVKEKLTLAKEDITYVKMLKNGETALELTTEGIYNKVSISSWMIVKPWQRAVDADKLDAFLGNIVAISMDSVAEPNAGDLKKYGLDKPVYDITIKGKGATNELLIGAGKDDYYTYVKFADGNTVYTVSKDLLSAVTGTTAYKLMDKMLILVNIQSAVGVEFNGLGQTGKMVITQTPAKDDKGEIKKDSNGNTTYDQTFAIGGKSIDDKVARYFYQVCIGLSTHSMIPSGWQPAAGLQPAATLTYTRNQDPYEIKVEFLPYDKDFYAVRLNGETNFLIQKEKVQDVADDVAKLKDGTLTVPES